MPDNKQRVVAVIPCYNTAAHIYEVVGLARQYVDEVIVVDDGSTDDTARIAREAGARVISHKRNLGYGKAIQSCFSAARKHSADVMVIIDGDGQHAPNELLRLIQPILEKEADIVIGSRFLDKEHTIPDYRKFGIQVITWLFNIGSKVKVSDAQSGYRAYGKRVIENLKLNERGMSNSVEILERARRNSYIIKEAPVSCRYDHYTLSTRAFKHGLCVALAVIKIRLNKNDVASNIL